MGNIRSYLVALLKATQWKGDFGPILFKEYILSYNNVED